MRGHNSTSSGSGPLTIVTDILQPRPAVRPPQRTVRALLVATLRTLRGRLNFRTLRRACDYCERTLARQLRGSCAGPDFHPRVLTAARDPRADLRSAPEASIIPQSGNQTVGLGHVFTGGAPRAERGRAIAPLAGVEVRRRGAGRLAGAQPPPGADKATSAPEEGEPRSDCDQQPLRDQRPRVPPRGTYHGGDGYCAKKQSSDEVVALQLHPSTKRRSAAHCLFRSTGPHPHRRGPRGKSDGTVTFQDRRRFAELGPLEARDPVQLSTALLWHGSRKRKLRGGDSSSAKIHTSRVIVSWPHRTGRGRAASGGRTTGRGARASVSCGTANTSPVSRTVRPAPRPRSLFSSLPRWRPSIWSAQRTCWPLHPRPPRSSPWPAANNGMSMNACSLYLVRA